MTTCLLFQGKNCQEVTSVIVPIYWTCLFLFLRTWPSSVSSLNWSLNACYLLEPSTFFLMSKFLVGILIRVIFLVLPITKQSHQSVNWHNQREPKNSPQKKMTWSRFGVSDHGFVVVSVAQLLFFFGRCCQVRMSVVKQIEAQEKTQ